MKRDLNLMRELLLRIENTDDSIIEMSSLVGEDESNNDVGFNLVLLKEACFITADIKTNIEGNYTGYVGHITPSGFDYLDSIRDPKIWFFITEKVKALGSGTKGVALEVIKSLAIDTVKGLLGSLPQL